LRTGHRSQIFLTHEKAKSREQPRHDEDLNRRRSSGENVRESPSEESKILAIKLKKVEIYDYGSAKRASTG